MNNKKWVDKDITMQFIGNNIFLVLLIPLFFIAIQIFSHPGAIINGDFPSFEASEHSLDRLWLWIDKGSYSGFENLARFPIIGFWALLSFFYISFEISTKLMIVLGFVLCSFSFYFSFYKLLQDKFQGSLFKLRIALVIGSIFFTYNVWSLNRIDHYYFWIGYSVLPVFFVYLIFSFRQRKLKYMIIASLTSIIASSTPHMILFYGFILLLVFLAYLFYNLWKHNYKNSLHIIVTLFSIVSLFVVFNLYWIFPYLLSYAESSGLIGPSYVLNLEIIEILSRDNDFSNTLRLVADWINFGSYIEPPPTSNLHSFWVFASYFFPAVSITGFLLWIKKLKYSIIIFVLLSIGVLLAMGTNLPFDYFSLLIATPFLDKFVWILRDPDKWSFLIAFSYSFFITLFSLFIFSLFSKRQGINFLISSIFVILIIGNIVVYSYPIYSHIFEERYNSIKIPDDFQDLNNYLSTLNTQKVFFMPFTDDLPYWSKNHTITGLYQLESVIPSNQIFYPIQINYYDYFSQLILTNETETISNFIYPFGSSYLIYHNDTFSKTDLNLLNNITNLKDLKNINDVGFFKIFNTPDYQQNLNIMLQNIAIVQGMDKLSLLNKIESFNSINSSIFFLDQNPPFDLGSLQYFDFVVMEPNFLDFVFSFLKSEYLLSPYDYTFHNDPLQYWSKVRAYDPLHGEFHPILSELGLHNWDFDFGKGLVVTKLSGAKLVIPFEVDKGGEYELFLRYLENFRGGNIKIYIDDVLVEDINSQATDTKFRWKGIYSDYISEGRHELTIENSNGFNAVNVFSLIPNYEFNQELSNLYNKIEQLQFIYLFDQSQFNIYENDEQEIVDIFEHEADLSNNINTSLIINGSLKIPDNVSFIDFGIESNYFDNQKFNPIQKLDLIPNNNTIVFKEDFESLNSPLELFGEGLISALQNKDNPISNITLNKNHSISDTFSLMVEINKSEIVDTTDWSYIITSYLPISDISNIKFKSQVDAKNVNLFHPVLYYYDSNFNYLSEDIIDELSVGSFQKEYDRDIIPPKNTKFIQIAFLFLPNNDLKSEFLLDNIELYEVIPSFSIGPEANGKDRYLNFYDEYKIDNTLSRNQSLIQIKDIPVVENNLYNYTIHIDGKDLKSISGFVNLKKSFNEQSFDIHAIDNYSSFIDNRSYRLFTNFDIVKNGQYDLFLKLQNYTVSNNNINIFPIKIIIDGLEKEYQVINEDKKSNNNLIGIHNINFTKGNHEIELVFPTSESKLEFAILYSLKDKNNNGNNSNINSIFTDLTSPAVLKNYTKIDPTKYIVEIENGTRPFVLMLSESFDPLWTATIVDGENVQAHNIPLFSIVNGFLINKTGNFEIIIEYLPQKWFDAGLAISFIVLILMIVLVLIYYKRKNNGKILYN